MVKHSQYFTKEQFATSMISILEISNVHRILDLGIGDAVLSLSALRRWSDAYVDSIDIDDEICKKVATLHSHIRIAHGDVLTTEGTSMLKPMSYDLALCNPPYGTICHKENYEELFDHANLKECMQIKRLSADIIFTAKNLLFLKNNGVLAIIIPDGLLTRKDLRPFRVALLEHHKVCKIFQLPERSFFLTEARTHILILQKNGSTEKKVSIGILDSNGNIKESIMVGKRCLYERMDFTYLKWKLKNHKEVYQSSTNITIQRGSLTYKSLRCQKYPYLHSNSFKNGEMLSLPQKHLELEDVKGHVKAETGDLIMCRVGKRSVGKVALVKEGKALLSDCVYKIIVPLPNRYYIFKRLLDERSQEWIKCSAHGVCSKVISKGDLIEYLAFLMNEQNLR